MRIDWILVGWGFDRIPGGSARLRRVSQGISKRHIGAVFAFVEIGCRPKLLSSDCSRCD